MSFQPENNAICRVCIQNQPDSTPIFNTETFSEQSLMISEVITTCASVQVHINDGLPEHICTKCLNDLHQAYNFRKLCEKSDCDLRNQLKGQFSFNSEIKIENDVWEEKPDSVDINYESSVEKEVTNEGVKLEFTAEDYRITADNKYVDENLIECPVGNIGNDIINTQKIKEENNDISEIKQNYEDLVEDSNPGEELKKRPEAAYKCDVCDKVYKVKKTLANHKKLHTEERYGCEVCGKQFTQKYCVKAHKKIHSEKGYACEYCDKRFTLSGNLLVHRTVHTGEKPFGCETCDKQFATKGNLIIHKRVHTEETPYKCDICSRAFKSLYTLRKHLKLHSGIKPYECSICKQTFADIHNMRRHMKVHNWIHECEECGKKFGGDKSLQRHMDIHARDKLKKPFKCNICKEMFSTKYSRRLHFKTHTDTTLKHMSAVKSIQHTAH